MPTFASSFIPTGGAEATRNADVLPFPFPARPQAMTVYVRFVEMGTSLIANTVLWYIATSGGSNPRLFLRTGAAGYAVSHVTLAGAVTATLAAFPSIGDTVEILTHLNSDGSLKLTQSINGAVVSETSTTAALMLAQAWSAQLLWVGSLGGSLGGFNAFRNLVFHRGVQSLETMRRLAGV